MEVSGPGKSLNSSLSFRYNANNEELEELFNVSDDDPPTPRLEPSPDNVVQNENASPKKLDKSSSLIDKYFKSMRTEKTVDKQDDIKAPESTKSTDDTKVVAPKEVTSSPMKDYLNRLSKKNSSSESTTDLKEGGNETWKIFHDFKFKIAQAVEDIKIRSGEAEVKEKCVPRENSMSDSEENSILKDSDQQSVGDTDNQVSSLDSSMQNLSDLTQPATAQPTERESRLPTNRNNSESSDDTHKNLGHSDSIEVRKDSFDENMMDIESGIEALEDSNIDTYGNITSVVGVNDGSQGPEEPPPLQPTPQVASFGTPPNKNNVQKPEKTLSPKNHFFNFPLYFLTFLLFVNYLLFPNSSIWNGFLLGIWVFWIVTSFKQWFIVNYLSAWEPITSSLFQLRSSSAMPPMYTIPSVKEHTPLKKYEGWINHYRCQEYDPYTYHVNKTTTAFIKVEGCNLRISYTKTKIAKRALWDEKIDKVVFYQHRLHNLTGARVILLPKGLVRKRQWSKKYPLCIILNEKEKIQVLEKETTVVDKKTEDKKKQDVQSQPQHEVESTETNTSPEKKRKFIWRRREKSMSHSDGESGKEGLRHRFARKMHKEKKSDSVSMIAEPVDSQDKGFQLEEKFHDAETDLFNTTNKDDVAEEDLDENDVARIKEFLEEAESEAGTEGGSEGEWSVHIKHSRESSHLYLFARTGRDKQEWYRRLISAISEANASADSSAADDRPSDHDDKDKDKDKDKDNIEMAVYKISEKETVSFAKKTAEVDISACPSPIPPIDMENYEKTFWPYLYKIIQSHERNMKSTAETGVTCQLEPSPHNRSNRNKKRATKSTDECACRTLPAEVAWVNAVLARLVYDVMRDPNTVAKVQNRIQRKLHTLKLPSFMSPLVVEALSLRGACPAVARVAAPAADERGLWLDADVRYDGGAHITVLTQINLMKLKEKNTSLEEQLLADAENVVETDPSTLFIEEQLRKRKPAIFDSDVEDSAESSSDEETPPLQPADSADTNPLTDTPSTIADGGTSSKKKFLRMVDKIATNKYFQQVTDYKYVKRAMEGLSNTDIRLQLEVVALEGRLALNLPHPPHDRLWIGFRTNPVLVLKARPGVGARALRFTHFSNWIEQRLSKEFEKVLVMPNMEDVLVDLMSPTPVQFN